MQEKLKRKKIILAIAYIVCAMIKTNTMMTVGIQNSGIDFTSLNMFDILITLPIEFILLFMPYLLILLNILAIFIKNEKYIKITKLSFICFIILLCLQCLMIPGFWISLSETTGEYYISTTIVFIILSKCGNKIGKIGIS